MESKQNTHQPEEVPVTVPAANPFAPYQIFESERNKAVLAHAHELEKMRLQHEQRLTETLATIQLQNAATLALLKETEKQKADGVASAAKLMHDLAKELRGVDHAHEEQMEVRKSELRKAEHMMTAWEKVGTAISILGGAVTTSLTLHELFGRMRRDEP